MDCRTRKYIMKYQMFIIGSINLNKYFYISDVCKGILILYVHLWLSNSAFIKLSINVPDTFYYNKRDTVCVVSRFEMF